MAGGMAGKERLPFGQSVVQAATDTGQWTGNWSAGSAAPLRDRRRAKNCVKASPAPSASSVRRRVRTDGHSAIYCCLPRCSTSTWA